MGGCPTMIRSAPLVAALPIQQQVSDRNLATSAARVPRNSLMPLQHRPVMSSIMRRQTFRLGNRSPRPSCAIVADHAGTDVVGQRLLSEGTPQDRCWPTPAGLSLTTKRPFAILDASYGLCIRSAGPFSVRTLLSRTTRRRTPPPTPAAVIHRPLCRPPPPREATPLATGAP
jgi:hypothetical protein